LGIASRLVSGYFFINEEEMEYKLHLLLGMDLKVGLRINNKEKEPKKRNEAKKRILTFNDRSSWLLQPAKRFKGIRGE